MVISGNLEINRKQKRCKTNQDRTNTVCVTFNSNSRKNTDEAYLTFKGDYPEIRISQRSFESLKPFFVIPVRQKAESLWKPKCSSNGVWIFDVVCLKHRTYLKMTNLEVQFKITYRMLSTKRCVQKVRTIVFSKTHA